MPLNECKTTFTASPTADPATSIETWLDLLPVEICTRIISKLSPFRRLRKDKLHYNSIAHLPDALAIAQVSANQRRAFGLAENGVIRVHRVNDCFHGRHLVFLWRSLLPTPLREVHLPNNIGVNHDVCQLLALSTIKKATIPSFPSFMRALGYGSSLESLDIKITNTDNIVSESGLDLLGNVLESCPVKELTLTCIYCGGPAIWNHANCKCIETLCHHSSFGPISGTLRSLRLICDSHLLRFLTYLRALFPQLDNFCLESSSSAVYMSEGPQLSPPVISTLQCVQSLGFVESGHVGRFADIFGPLLTELSSSKLHSDVRVAETASIGNSGVQAEGVCLGPLHQNHPFGA